MFIIFQILAWLFLGFCTSIAISFMVLFILDHGRRRDD